MARESILVVEDEQDIQELVSYNLKRDGYDVSVVGSGEEAIAAVRKSLPDLVLLDLMLPGLDGREVCRELKGDPETRHIPVVMLTARGEESDIVAGLEMGADDYVTKPFSPKVLSARVGAVLRRRSRPDVGEDEVIIIDDLVIHPGKHEVKVSGELAPLTSTEFKILHFLARRPSWVYTRRQIVQGVHGEDHPVLDRSIDVQIASLRKKLGPAGDRVETVRGVGYRFSE